MTPPAQLARALVALLAAAPASARAGASAYRWPAPPPTPKTVEVARAGFEPPAFEAVFSRAVEALARNGYELQACDAGRGSLATRPREFDAPCGASTCLARESVALLLGYRAARVTVLREIFDPTVKA